MMTAWRHIDLDAALGVLDGWSGRRVIVSVDLATGACGLAGMAGVLRGARRGDGAVELELEDSEAWLRLPGEPSFRGASHDAGAEVLVLEFCDDDAERAPAVLVDIEVLRPVAALEAAG